MNKILFLGLGLPGVAFFSASLMAESATPTGHLLVPVLVIVLLIILNGIYVAAEFAINGVRPTQIEELLEEKGDHAATQLVLDTLEEPAKQSRYIATSQLGITLASLGLGMYGAPQIAHFIEPYLTLLIKTEPSEQLLHTLGYIIALSILTYLHVVFGEIIPKTIVLSGTTNAAIFLARPLKITEIVFKYPVQVLNSVGNKLLKSLNLPPTESRLHSTSELEQIVSESADRGLLNEKEEDFILNILSFDERQVHQVMTPRPKVEAIDIKTSLPDIIEFATHSPFSRFPIYETDFDNILGILHLKDIIRQQLNDTPFNLQFLLRPAVVVPEHYPAEQLLNAFKRRRLHMAIVMDEFGGTAGIVTLEDLVEEVIGEIRDEFDKKEQDPLIELGPGALEVSGHFLLEDLEEYVTFDEVETLPDIETIGGLIVTKLGRPPQSGDTLTSNNGSIQLAVLFTDGRAVARVRIDYPIDKTQHPQHT